MVTSESCIWQPSSCLNSFPEVAASPCTYQEIASSFRQYLKHSQEATFSLLRWGRSLDLERQRLHSEHGQKKGNKLFKEWLSETEYSLQRSSEAIALYQSYSRLPFSLRKQLHRVPQLWRIETLKGLLKLAIGQIAKAIAQIAQDLCTVPKKLIAQFAPKKYLTPSELITEENWDAIAQLLTQKLKLDEGQLEEIKQQALALAGEELLTCDHLLQALEARDYTIDSLLPPVKAQALKPEEIEQIEQASKGEGYQRGREEAIAEFTAKIEQIQQEHQRQIEQMRQESEARFQQLEQQMQAVLRQSSQRTVKSTVGAQEITDLLKANQLEEKTATTFVPLNSHQPSKALHSFSSSKTQPHKTSGQGFGQPKNSQHSRRNLH